MSTRLALVLMAVWLSVSNARAEIVVVYPRTAAADQTFIYEDGLDSSFIFGRIEPPNGDLLINGVPTEYTERGAFLAFLPLRDDSATKRWDLALIQQGQVVDSLTVLYLYRRDVPPTAMDSVIAVSFPRVIRVTDSAAHTRTVPGGSYHLFPQAGTRLLAVGYQSGFFEFELGGGMTGFIERRFVEVETDSTLPSVRVSDGECRQFGDTCLCQFAIGRVVPWNAELSEDGHVLELQLFNTTLAVDRIRFEAGSTYITDIQAAQAVDGTVLSFRFRERLTRGFDVQFGDGSLTVNVRSPFSKRDRRLKGKTVVVDAGHGGPANGAIGPLGTSEKDVTLRWSRILAAELKRKGAHPVLTRDDDADVPLAERVNIGRRAHANFLVSLHANALPDGANPFERHGTGTYYYQSLSQPAAEKLHKQLLKASGLRDDGLYDANFAVVRPTSFPAVLLEAAYIMYPPEEELLLSDKYLRKLAKGVVRGLGEYFKSQN